MNIYPDFRALGDNTTLQTVIGAILTFIFITAVLIMMISDITWVLSTAHGNHTTTKARTELLVVLGAAALIGAGVAWLNWLTNLGDQL